MEYHTKDQGCTNGDRLRNIKKNTWDCQKLSTIGSAIKNASLKVPKRMENKM